MAIQFDVDAAIAKIAVLVQTHGPQAMETAIQVTRIDAINTLIQVPANAGLAFFGFKAAQLLARRAKKASENADAYDVGIAGAGWAVGSGAAAIFGVVALIIALTGLFDAWAWVGLFNPQLGLAHKIMLSIGGDHG